MMLGAALTVGVTPIEVKEIIYQAVPYVGMAKVFGFLHATNEALSERGVELPPPGQSTTDPEIRLEKGLAVQKQIVGADRVETLYASAPADQQHIQRLLSANCFDDYCTRTGVAFNYPHLGSGIASFAPRAMSVSRERPRQMTVFPGGGSRVRAR